MLSPRSLAEIFTCIVWLCGCFLTRTKITFITFRAVAFNPGCILELLREQCKNIDTLHAPPGNHDVIGLWWGPDIGIYFKAPQVIPTYSRHRKLPPRRVEATCWKLFKCVELESFSILTTYRLLNSLQLWLLTCSSLCQLLSLFLKHILSWRYYRLWLHTEFF